MKKRFIFLVLSCILMVCCLPISVLGVDVSNEEILKEIRALKARVSELENELKKKDQEIDQIRDESFRDTDGSSLRDENAPKDGLIDQIGERISVCGLVEVGAAYEDVKNNDGTDWDSSDINLTTVEIGVGVVVNEWVNLETILLYEDPFHSAADDESDMSIDVAVVTVGDPGKCPFYVSAGKMYVPFGALLTHLPDDPLVDQPMTLLFGEISEKAVLVGYENFGFAVSGYMFNGDVDDSASDNAIENYGFDINYTAPENNPVALFAGLSYISNIAEGLGGVLHDLIIEDYVHGFGAYLHLGFNDVFLEAEYMTAMDEFAPGELYPGPPPGGEAKPSVWNIEAGYNWNWGKDLELVFKWAGSDETGQLGYPEKRYAIGFNQEIFSGVIGSVAYFKDVYHSKDVDNRDRRDIICGQVAVEF